MAKKQSLVIDDAVSEVADEDVLLPEISADAPEAEEVWLEKVDLDFNKELADLWLGQSWQRLHGVVYSVRVYSAALAPRETPWGVENVADGLLEMAYHAVEPAGYLEVPEEFANSLVLQGKAFEQAPNGFVRYTK